jgi:O-antigen/teichoic acid export membrane protein
MVGGSMLANVLNYIYHLAMGRILGPVDYGVLASLFSILYIVSIVPTSTSVAIVKFISSSVNKEKTASVYFAVRKLIFVVALVVAVLVAIASPVIADFLHIENILLVVLISPILFFSFITLVNQSTSQGLLKFMGFILPAVVSSVVKLVLGIALVLIGWSVLGAIWAIVIGALVAYFVSLPFVKKIRETKISGMKYNIRPFLSYSLPVLLQALAFTSIFTVDVILAKHFLTAFDAGIYAALSTLGKIIYFASSPITAVMFPVVAGRSVRGEKYTKIFLASLGLTLLISVSIVLLYYLFPNVAIGMLYGKEYLSAKLDLIWMGLFILIYTLSMLLVNFLLSLGKTRAVIFPVIASVVQVGLIWRFHSNIREIIQVSLIACSFIFVGVGVYLGYNSIRKIYEKR